VRNHYCSSCWNRQLQGCKGVPCSATHYITRQRLGYGVCGRGMAHAASSRPGRMAAAGRANQQLGSSDTCGSLLLREVCVCVFAWFSD
jgi:hypothetical protein